MYVKPKIRDFLWEGFGADKSSHLVLWKIVTKPKGGGWTWDWKPDPQE